MAKATKTSAEVTEQVTEVTEVTEVTAEQEKEPVMYVGPTIPGISIQNSVYSEIPAAAAEAFEVLPSLRHLYVPIREYPKSEEQIRKHDGRIYRAFMRALEFKEKRKGGN